ncbi:universal stress protein [Roseovarius spongiae]|uniref:Universal stress protein n=1 Tax=Roseovarius spongiae TaxID=2320272 RepID=A0A3A8ATA5_9RHOB|nr:universal stress protein [Roseovarius spongiae]RKF14764.1 universal stress protein [Roseovarius spongiae]
MTITRILAAVDRFPQDETVLARAARIAAAHGAALRVAHVVDLPGDESDLERADTLIGQAAIAARDRINDALRRLGASAEICIETGSPALRLIGMCEETRPDLVVMRAHQRERITDRILGSTTDRVVAAAGAPVLITRRPVVRGYVRALLATDGSDAAAAALSFTAALLPDTDIHIIQAVQITPQLSEAMLRIGASQATLDAHRDALARAAAEHLGALVAEAPRTVTTRVLHGDPALALARATRSSRADLIVLGPGRAGLIRRAFIGSVTRRLLRDAACDVLIFRH